MNDTDPPKCQVLGCGGTLRKFGERENPTAYLGVDAFLYVCPDCGAQWNDNLDGEPLKRRAEPIK